MRKLRKPNPLFDVRALRRRLGLQQRELAKLIRTSQRTISRWEVEGIKPQRIFYLRLLKLEAERQQLPDPTPLHPDVPEAPPPPPRPVRRLPPPPLGKAVPMRAIGILPSSF